MELSFVVWNTQRKALYKEVADLAFEQNTDFIILIENTADRNQLVNQLSAITGRLFSYHNNINFDKGDLYSVDSINSVRILFEHQRYCIWEIATNKFLFNLCIVHFPSKNNWGNQADHDAMCVQLIQHIRHTEEQNGHKRTIIVGDFNMNPFENGMMNANGLHSIMNRDIAKTGSREVLGTHYDFFYNPMWSFFGDLGRGSVNGTYYHNTSTYLSHFWNMYDQVLIRPDLTNNFDDSNLLIVENIKGVSLTKVIRSTVRVDDEISDHLPLKFKLNF